MNFAMWSKALKVIPHVSREEWNHLDLVSKWLISTRAAVLVMTLISATAGRSLCDTRQSFPTSSLAGIDLWPDHGTRQ